MINFMDLVKLGAHATSDTERSESENKIIDFRENNTVEFFGECAQCLNESSIDNMYRSIVGTIFMNSLKAKDKHEQLFWNALSNQQKEKMKLCFYSLLAEKDVLIKKIAAQSVAIMFINEFREGKWGDVLENMVGNCDATEFNIKTSAILTLGYICQDLAHLKITLDSQQSEVILSGIFKGLDDKVNNYEIRKIAFKALLDSIGYMKALLESDLIRNHLMAIIVTTLMDGETDLKILAYQVLIETLKSFYHTFKLYMEKLSVATIEGISSQDHTISVLATEYWGVLAEIELGIKRSIDSGFIPRFPSFSFIYQRRIEITPRIMLNLRRSESGEDDDETTSNSIFASSYNTLITMNSLLCDDLKDMNLEFIKRYIESADPQERIAALASYACMVHGVSQIELNTIFKSSIENIISMLKNQHETMDVRVWCVRVLQEICRCKPAIFLKKTCLDVYANPIMTCLEDDRRLGRNILILFQILGSEALDDDISNSLLGTKGSEFINEISRIGFQEKNHSDLQFIQDVFNTLVVLFDKILDKRDTAHFVNQLIVMMEESVGFSRDFREILHEGLLVCLQILLWKYVKLDMTFYEADGVLAFNRLEKIFNQTQDVPSEGMLTLFTLGANLKNSFESIQKQVFQLVEICIERRNNHQTMLHFFQGVAMLVRDRRALPQNYMDQIVIPKILDVFNDSTLPHENRASMLISFGDYFMFYYDLLQNHLEQIFTVFSQAFEACIHFLNQDGQMFEHGDSLKTSIMSSFQTIGISIMNSNSPGELVLKQLGRFMEDVVRFVEITTDRKYNPTFEYIATCLGIICDVYCLDTKNYRELIRHGVCSSLTEKLIPYANRNDDAKNVLEFYKMLLESS